jgi:proline racemase
VFLLFYATIVACAQSKVGDTLAHVSVIGTSFQRIACNEYANGESNNVTESWLYDAWNDQPSTKP